MNTSDLDLDAFDAIEDTPPVATEQPSEDSTLSLVAEAGEQRGPTIGQQATGLAIEAGGGIGGVYATQKVMQSAKVAKGLNILKNIRRAGQAAAVAGAAGPQAAEPISTGLGLLSFGITEAVWAVGSNYVKQEYFKGLGVQEETSGGELLTSALLISPLIKQGTRIPKLGQVFDTSMIKSRTWKVGAHTVQGATIGAVESSIRQTWDLMADEDADLGDFSFQDLAQGTVLGGGMGGVASLGADGIKLVRAYRKVVARNKVEMRGSLVERLAKLDKTIAKAEKLGSNRQRIVAEMHAAKAKKELDELDAVHDSMDEELGNVEAGLLSQEKKPEPAPEASATTATPKDAPEPTPAPKTPEGAPEASPMQQLRDRYKRAIADQDKGKGAFDVVELDANFRVASDDFSKRVDAMIADTSPENVASVSEIIDDYIDMDALDAQLRQKTGQMQHGHRKDAGEAKYTNEMSENRQIRQEALKGVRDKLDTLKEDGGGDDIQKLVNKIFEEPVEAPKPTPKKTTPQKNGEEKPTATEEPTAPKAPKKTPKERAVARLQKRLDELRAIRSSTADELETPVKPKRAKSAEEKDLEDRIKFYTGETKELNDIVAMNERITVLSGLMRGESLEEIQMQIGLPPKLKPSYLKPKKIESELTRLKDTEKRLMKMLRKRQTDEVLNDLKDAFDPENGQRSPMDRLLNKYLEERTDALLNQPSTVTTGLPSGLIQILWRPTVGTARSAVKAASPLDSDLKGVGMTQRMKFAAADVIATFDQLVSVARSPIKTAVQVGRNVVDTVKAGGQSAFFYKDGNKIDMNEGATVGNATIRNTKQVDRAAMRVAANQQKGAITRAAMKMLASDPAATFFAIAKGVRAAGRTGVGTFDEPFIMILEGRRVRADAYREAIKQQPSDPAAFIDDYIAKASNVDKQGVKRFNYLDEKYKDGANEVRKGLFRRADLEADDYRVQAEENVINFWGKLTGGDPTMGKFFLRFMQPIFTTPTIGLIQSGRHVAYTKGLPLAANVGQRAYSEVAKRTGQKGKISNILSGRVNKEINDHEIEIERLKTEKKKEGLDPKELQKLDDELAATEQQLKSAVAYRTEKIYDDIAHTALLGGMAMAAFEAGRQGVMSGAGSFLERDQRNNGEFEKYRGLADKASTGWNYLLADPFRTVVALYADLGARSVLEEEGKLTEQQNWGNFITSTMEAYATDAVFSTSLRQIKDLAFGQEKSRTDAVIDIAAGAALVPSWYRNLNSFNDEAYSVHGQGAKFRDIPDRAMQKALGNESDNYRVDKLGRPLKRNERGPLNYVFRYAPEERARRMQAEEEVRNVLRADSFQHNLFPTFPKAPSINGVSIPLDKFTKGRKTLLTAFHEMTNENEDFLHELGDLVTSDDWLDDYANYQITKNPTNPEKPYNEGMKRLVDVRNEYIEKAKTQLQDPSSDAQFYRNKDGQTIYDYIERFNTPTEETNRTVTDILKIQ